MRKKKAGKNHAVSPSRSVTSRLEEADIARQAAQAMVRTLEERLQNVTATNRTLKRKIFDLYTIFEISRNFNAVLDYKSLLDSFIFTCLGQVGGVKGALFLKSSSEAHEFCVAAAKGSGPLPAKGSCFRDDSKLADLLTRLNRPILLADLIEEVLTPVEIDLLTGFEGGLVVPLIYKTRLAGMFVIADKMAGGGFGPDEIEFLSSLGNQISVAIENARLYEAESTANEQLWSTQQRLLQAERLAALGEMSAMVAHEVNNPLGIIKNYMLLLKRIESERPEVSEYANIVSQEIDRIAMIVQSLRQFSRQDEIEFSPVNLVKAMDEALVLTQWQSKAKKITIVREGEEGEFWVNGNNDYLKQVFLNLVLNAYSVMDDEGTLTTSVSRQDEMVRLTITDTGGGAPDDVLPRMFEPFFTTKGDKGSGLGLSICDSIIKNLKGSISFKNVEGGGEVTILLPLLKQRLRL